MTANMIDSWFVKAMVKATTDCWDKGWDERNGGNISLRLTDDDIAPYLAGIREPRRLPMTEPLPAIAGQSYIVTGTGKFFRNVQLDPENNSASCASERTAVIWKCCGAIATVAGRHRSTRATSRAISPGRIPPTAVTASCCTAMPPT
jgi:L-rhamnulose 1-phosphate aldolase (EC 4.1.2.19)